MSKKVISVFALPSHVTKDRVSGVDFARVIQPAKHLAKYKDPEVTFKVTVYDPAKDETMNWQEVAEKHDIIFFNYTAMPWEFAKMGLLARKYNRLLIMDCDDAIFYIKPDNPVYESFKKGSENLRNFIAICNEVDYMTTTNRFLRNVICRETAKSTDRVEVLDNFIDMETLYNYVPKFRNEGNITITHFGSTTHFVDLSEESFVEGMDRVMKSYPNVKFLTVGALLPKLKYKWGQRYENSYGHQDVYTWIKERFPVFMEKTDIVVAPLSDTTYDKSKSAIKFLEYSSAKKPGVFQDIRQYSEKIENGVNGYLAYSPDEWFSAISKLIDDVEHRKSVGEEAYKTAREYTIQDNVCKYAKFFSRVYDAHS